MKKNVLKDRSFSFFESPSGEYRTLTPSGGPLQSMGGPDRYSAPGTVESRSQNRAWTNRLCLFRYATNGGGVRLECNGT